MGLRRSKYYPKHVLRKCKNYYEKTYLRFNNSEFNEVNKFKNSWKVSLCFEPDFSCFHDKSMAYLIGYSKLIQLKPKVN